MKSPAALEDDRAESGKILVRPYSNRFAQAWSTVDHSQSKSPGQRGPTRAG